MTEKKEQYTVPHGFGEAELVEKKSRFIARVWPVETEAQAIAHITAMREQHWDATHNVYAYIIKNGQTRFSDDGEPQGTSGLPTLNVFRQEAVFNVCCVITRYFGGTLLGAGGLVRAYTKAAKLGLEAAGLDLMRLWELVLIPCPYALYERMKGTIEEFSGLIESADFAADVTIQAYIPATALIPCAKRIMDISAGSIELVPIDTVFRGIRIR